MTKDFLYRFIKTKTLGVISTLSTNNKPESALIGLGVTESLEIIFDTVTTSRKYLNLIKNPFVAMVIGWDNETTLQLEGVASELSKTGDEKYKEAYFETYPDGRQRAETWPDIVHFKITPAGSVTVTSTNLK